MLSKAQFEKIALGFEGAEKGSSFGHEAIVIGKSFFTRYRAEDHSAVIIVGSLDEREMLMEVEPETFHITAHYKNYPAVLARLEKLDTAALKGLLTRQWQKLAAKTKKKTVKKTVKKAAPEKYKPTGAAPAKKRTKAGVKKKTARKA